MKCNSVRTGQAAAAKEPAVTYRAAADEADSAAIGRSCTDPQAFAAIFERHFVAIHRYLARRLGADVADDLAGDVFRIAFERRQDFDLARPSALPWLYGIATKLMQGRWRSEMRHLRALERLRAGAHVDTDLDSFDLVDRRLDAAHHAARAKRCLADLSSGDRDALILFAVEGLAYAEVAEALQIPIGTVRSRIARARGRLREPDSKTRQELVEPAAREKGHG